MLNPLIAGEPTTVDVLEQTTPKYTATITDDAGVALPAANLTTLTLSLYVIKSDGTIAYVNTRTSQNVLNTNNVTVDTNGLLTWSVQVADTTLVEALSYERHIALFTWTWSSGAKTGRHELVLTVKHLQTVS